MLKPWIVKSYLNRIYWAWRLSLWSRPWFWLKTWFHLLWNAKRTASALLKCMRSLGQMHLDSKGTGMRVMDHKACDELVRDGYSVLPDWKW